VGEHKITVVISEEDLAQAIGREGQNIRLASKMLDKEIDVYGDEEFANMTEEERTAALKEPVYETDENEEMVPETGDEPATEEPESTEDGGDDTNAEETNQQDVADDDEEETETDEGEDPVLGEIANKAIDTLSTTDEDAEEAIDKAQMQSDGVSQNEED
jgi:N utilization substance protein A